MDPAGDAARHPPPADSSHPRIGPPATAEQAAAGRQKIRSLHTPLGRMILALFPMHLHLPSQRCLQAWGPQLSQLAFPRFIQFFWACSSLSAEWLERCLADAGPVVRHRQKRYRRHPLPRRGLVSNRSAEQNGMWKSKSKPEPWRCEPPTEATLHVE
jgi:hypothetical protein